MILDSNMYIEHFGKKGMKWGVRKDSGHEGERARTKKIAKLDKKFERDANSLQSAIKIYNNAVNGLNGKTGVINNKPQYRSADFTNDSPLRRQYYNEMQNAMLSELRSSAKSLGTNASGTKRYDITEAPRQNQPFVDWKITVNDVQHSSLIHASETFLVKLIYNNTGHIISCELDNEGLVQSMDLVSDFLSHYGVQGMRWGKRGTRRVQKKIDRATRIVEGRASTVDQLLRSGITKKGITRQLQRGANQQAKINAGKMKATNVLATVSGVKIKNLKYPMPGDPNAKLDSGQKAALAFVGTMMAVNVATTLASQR